MVKRKALVVELSALMLRIRLKGSRWSYQVDCLRDLQQQWDGASRWYDFATAGLEVLIFRRLRSQLLKSAVGRVLEVAAGTGSIWRTTRRASTSSPSI